MQHPQLIRGSRLSLTHLDLPGLHRCEARRRTQRHSNFRPFVTSNGHSSSGAESTSGRHTPRPRQLDRAAAALVRGEGASDDLIQTALVGLGFVAVAAAAGLELLSSIARQRHETYITGAAYACQKQMVELQAEMEVAQGLGKKGLKSVEELQRQQTVILVDASTYAARQPSYGTAHSWSVWAVCLALLCQLILTIFTNKRCSLTRHNTASNALASHTGGPYSKSHHSHLPSSLTSLQLRTCGLPVHSWNRIYKIDNNFYFHGLLHNFNCWTSLTLHQ